MCLVGRVCNLTSDAVATDSRIFFHVKNRVKAGRGSTRLYSLSGKLRRSMSTLLVTVITDASKGDAIYGV